MTALVGAFNWLVVKPRLANPQTISLLRKSAAVELTIGLAVVILTAILVGTSPPDEDEGMKEMPGMQSSVAPAMSVERMAGWNWIEGRQAETANYDHEKNMKRPESNHV